MAISLHIFLEEERIKHLGGIVTCAVMQTDRRAVFIIEI